MTKRKVEHVAGQKRNRGGRPRLLASKEKREQVFDVLKSGGSRTDAAGQAGCSIDTIAEEARRDLSFAEGLIRAESDGKLALVRRISSAAAAGDWKAAAWMLERKWWREWSKRTADQVTPDQLASVIGRIVASILAEIPSKYHARVRTKIDDILGSLTGLANSE